MCFVNLFQDKTNFYLPDHAKGFARERGEDNAIATKNSKPNFTIILNDNSFALKQDDKNHKDYFIGKVTDYVFVYSDSLKNVRAIPVSDIKEIRFPLGE